MMDMIAIGCFILAIPQGVASIIQIYEWRKHKGSAGPATLSRASFYVLTVALVLGTCLAAGFGFWFKYHPLKPITVVQRTVIEKPVPCPSVINKSGSASSHGSNSPANSGVDNQTYYGVPPASDQKSPQKKEKP